MNKLYTSCLVVLVTLVSGFSIPAFAAQEFSVKDGDTVNIKISSTELTRVSIYGEGRIEKVWGAAGILDIQPDKEKGEIFIRPNQVAAPALSFFVRDDMGSTYTLVAIQHDIPSETVILKPKGSRVAKQFQDNYRSTPFIKTVKDLMRSMALGQDQDGYSIEFGESKEIPLWRETKIQLETTYTGYELLGEVYSVRNISDKDIVFSEKEFLDFGDRVYAVALERLSIGIDETTLLYVVRKASNGGM